MRVIGLTGSIGMGKSTTAAMFREAGVPVYDADAAVHDLYDHGGAAVGPVGEAFPGVVKDGRVDREALRQAVLGKPEELRRLNAARIGSFAGDTASELLWRGVVFHPFTNNAVESAFADRRTYVSQGREVDRQVHLGFDLASYAQTPNVAANRGRVLFAAELGPKQVEANMGYVRALLTQQNRWERVSE